MMSATEDMSAPSSPAPSITDSTPNSLLSAMTFSSSLGVIKASAELKTVKRELFRAQHQQRLLKIDLERERAARLQEKAAFETQIRDLEAKLVEANHDIEFLNEAEGQAKLELKALKTKTTSTERELRNVVTSLKQKLAVEQDARIEAEERVARLFSEQEEGCYEDPSEEFEALVEEWKTRVDDLQDSENTLSARVTELEQENELLKSKLNVNEEYEVLNRIMLSTFSSLEEAKSELQRRQNEVERISARIGSVLELEERLRTATVELNRLKSSEQSRISSPSPQTPIVAKQVPVSAVDTLKIASLSAEIAQLREQFLISQGQAEALKAELESKSTAFSSQASALKEAQRRIFELEARLKNQ